MFRQLTNCIRRRVGPLGLAVVFAFLSAAGAWAQTGNWASYRQTTWPTAADKSGTTYTISTAEQLAQFAYLVNNGTSYLDSTITVTADIDLGAHYWTPIGTASARPFRGTFDGQSRIIRNLKINDLTLDAVGLFGYVSVTPLNGYPLIKNVHLTGTDVTGKLNVGSIAGVSYFGAVVQDCTNSGSVRGVGNGSGMMAVGGIIGYGAGAASNDHRGLVNYGTVTVDSDSAGTGNYNTIGGIIGRLDQGYIRDAINFSAVSCNGNGKLWQVGGIVGGNASGSSNSYTVRNCRNAGAVNITNVGIVGVYKSGVGGIIGASRAGSSPGIIRNCVNTGTLNIDAGLSTAVLTRGAIGGIFEASASISGDYLYWKPQGDLTAFGSVSAGTFANNVTFGNAPGTLATAVLGKTSLLDALNAWVDGNNSSATFYTWVLDAAGDNYPVHDIQYFTKTLTSALVNTAYSNDTGATYGDRYTLLTPAQLPPGLTMSAEGLISGTPLTKGTYSFSVKVTAYDGTTKTVVLTLSVVSEKLTVIFDADGGTPATQTKTLTRGVVYEFPPEPTRKGYEFYAWFTGPSFSGTLIWNMTKVPVNDETQTLYASWTSKAFTVTLDANGGAPSTQVLNVYFGEAMPAPVNPAAPTREGFTFDGYWDTSATTGGTQYYTAAMASARIWDKDPAETLYARWIPDAVDVVFDADGGTPATQTVPQTKNTKWVLAASPTRTGYTFGGWYPAQAGSGTQITTSVTVTEPIPARVYAKWTAQTAVMTFNLQGGNIGGSTTNPKITQTYGSPLSFPNDPAYTGKSFIGWHTTNNKATGVLIPKTTVSTYTAAATVHAWYTNNVYAVTFDYDGATGNITTMSKPVVFSEAYGTLPATPLKTGHTFGGWFINGAGNEILSTTTVATAANHTLKAQWTPLSNITITFNKNATDAVDGTLTSKVVSYGDALAALTAAQAPTRTGYTFAGYNDMADGTGKAYYTGLTAAVATWDKTANATLHAQWTPLSNIKITFNKNASDAVNGTLTSKTVSYGDALVNLTAAQAPTRPGHAFMGYNDKANGSGKTYYNGLTAAVATWDKAANATLYAQWEARNGWWFTDSTKTQITDGTWTFEVNGNTTNEMTVAKVVGKPATPQVLDFSKPIATPGYQFSVMGESLFSFSEDSALVSELIFNEGLKELRMLSFCNLTLRAFTLPESLEKVAAAGTSFMYCSAITNVYLLGPSPIGRFIGYFAGDCVQYITSKHLDSWNANTGVRGGPIEKGNAKLLSFIRLPGYMLALDAGTNGGSLVINDSSVSVSNQWQSIGYPYVLPEPAPAAGCTFKGWFSTAYGNVKVTENDLAPETQAYATLYAQYGMDVPDWVDIDEDARTITHPGLDVDLGTPADNLVIHYPEGATPGSLFDEFGYVTIPEGGSLTSSGDIELTDKDGNIIPPESIITGNGTIIIPPPGGVLIVNEDGTVTIPEGSKVYVYVPPMTEIVDPVVPGGTYDPSIPGIIVDTVPPTVITIPDGVVIIPDDIEDDPLTGKIVIPGQDGIVGTDDDITVPNGTFDPETGYTTVNQGPVTGKNEEILKDKDGNVIPPGSIITDDGVIIIPPPGGELTVNDDGTITIPDGGKVYVYDPPMTEIVDPLHPGGTYDPSIPGIIIDGTEPQETILIPSGVVIVDGEPPSVIVPGPDGKYGTDDDVTIQPATQDDVDSGTGAVTVPEGSVVSTNGVPLVIDGITDDGTFPEGTVVLEDGTIIVPGPNADGTPKVNPDGTVDVSPGDIIIPPPYDKPFVVPEPGGTYDPEIPGIIIDDNVPPTVILVPSGSIVGEDEEGPFIIVPGPDGIPGTDDDVKVQPADKDTDYNPDTGIVTVPEGGSVISTNGVPIVIDGITDPEDNTFPEGTLVLPDGTIIVPGPDSDGTPKDNGDGTVDVGTGDIIIVPPYDDPFIVPGPGGTYDPDIPGVILDTEPPSTILVPAGVVIVDGEPPSVIVPGPDGDYGTDDDVTIRPATQDDVDPGTGIVTVPEPGSTISTNGVPIIIDDISDPDGTFPPGTLVLPDGTIIVPGPDSDGTPAINPDGTVDVGPGDIIILPPYDDPFIVPEPGGKYDPTIPGVITDTEPPTIILLPPGLAITFVDAIRLPAVKPVIGTFKTPGGVNAKPGTVVNIDLDGTIYIGLVNNNGDIVLKGDIPATLHGLNVPVTATTASGYEASGTLDLLADGVNLSRTLVTDTPDQIIGKVVAAAIKTGSIDIDLGGQRFSGSVDAEGNIRIAESVGAALLGEQDLYIGFRGKYPEQNTTILVIAKTPGDDDDDLDDPPVITDIRIEGGTILITARNLKPNKRYAIHGHATSLNRAGFTRFDESAHDHTTGDTFTFEVTHPGTPAHFFHVVRELTQ